MLPEEELLEKTLGNHADACGGWCVHVMTDLHDCARILHRIEALLDQLQPMISAQSPAAALGAARRARKAARG